MEIESQILLARKELDAVRTERDETTDSYKAQQIASCMSIERHKAKIAKLLRRGCDASRYNRAIQDLYSNNSSKSSNGSSSNNNNNNINNGNNNGSSAWIMPQAYLQQQIKIFQMLHKSDIYQHQIEVIERHSFKTLNDMMGEASAVKKEQQDLEHELMIQQGEFMNASFLMETNYHRLKQAQKDVIRRIKALLLVATIVPAAAAAETNNNNEMKSICIPKIDDSCSVGTIDTIHEF